MYNLYWCIIKNQYRGFKNWSAWVYLTVISFLSVLLFFIATTFFQLDKNSISIQIRSFFVDTVLLLSDEIKNIQSNKKTILITSHEMATIEKFCTRVGILKNGKLLAVLKMEKIREMIKNTEKFENFEDFISALLYKKA